MMPYLNLDALNNSIERLLSSSSDSDALVIPLKKLVIAQIFSHSVCLLSSSAMATMICRTEKKLSTPYRRIIFAISISTIMANLAYIFGPFLIPRDVPSSWGVGNGVTCRASGFLAHLGSNFLPPYVCFLCWYYLCKLKYRMTNETFRQKYEWKIHASIVLLTTAIASAVVALGIIHPVVTKNMCVATHTPLGCKFVPHLVGECDSTIESRWIIMQFIIHAYKLLSLIGMIVFSGMLYWHVIQLNRIFQPTSTSTSTRNLAHNAEANWTAISNQEDKSDDSGGGGDPEDTNTQNQIVNDTQDTVRYLSSLYRNEVVIQGCGYVLVFILIYIPGTLVLSYRYFAGVPPPKILQGIAFILTPFAAACFILVYTRPMVASLRRRYPDRSRIACFCMVLKAGGELPEFETPFTVDGSLSAGGGADIRSIPFEIDDPRFSLSEDFRSIETPPFAMSSNDISPFQSVEEENARRSFMSRQRRHYANHYAPRPPPFQGAHCDTLSGNNDISRSGESELESLSCKEARKDDPVTSKSDPPQSAPDDMNMVSSGTRDSSMIDTLSRKDATENTLGARDRLDADDI